MAAVSRGLPFRRNARTKRCLQHQNGNLVLDLVLRMRGVLAVPRRLDQKLSNTRLSRGAVGRQCSSRLVDSGLP